MELVTPKMWPKTPTNKRLLERITHLTFPGPNQHPGLSGRALTDAEFISPLIVAADEGGKAYITFWNDDYFNMSEAIPNVGTKMVVRAPEPNSIGQVAEFIGTITSVEAPLGFEWLANLIRGGQIPAVLGQISFTFDFFCSIWTALDLNGAVWKWPVVAPLPGTTEPPTDLLHVGPEVLEAIAAISNKPLQFTDKLSGSSSDRKVMLAILNQCERMARESISVFDSAVSAVTCLPLATMITCTATKSVLGWRTWLLSGSDAYEVAWMKDHLYKYLSDAVGPLFHDCGFAGDNLRLYEQAHGIES